VYSIEWTVRGLQLIVDDVCAGSLEIVNGLPDWVIEREASGIAFDADAVYM
jgi:hypothetical protein